MLPDVSHALDTWLQDLTLRIVSKTYDDEDSFDPTFVFTDTAIQGVIQVAKPEEVNADNVDVSLRYLRVHTKSLVAVGQFLIDRSISYKIIDVSNWSDGGYYEVTAEQVRGDYS